VTRATVLPLPIPTRTERTALTTSVLRIRQVRAKLITVAVELSAARLSMVQAALTIPARAAAASPAALLTSQSSWPLRQWSSLLCIPLTDTRQAPWPAARPAGTRPWL